MSDVPLERSAFSLHFNKLKLMGAWVVSPNSALLVNVYSAYKTAMTLLAGSGCVSLFFDFYLVFGNLKKMSWNLCISTLFTGSLIKNIHTIRKSPAINRLRRRLHSDAAAAASPDDDALHRRSVRELRYVQLFFYGLAAIFVPTWLVTFYLGYFWSPKDMPIPLRLPIHIDTDNELQYNLAFCVIGLGGLMGIILVLETELAMFTLLIQISREYQRLLKDIPKLDELYSRGDAEGPQRAEVNPTLRKLKAKTMVKEYSTRQQKLIEYTEAFEMSYSTMLLLQVFVMSVLVIVSAIQCILEFGNLTMNVSYQMGYIFMLVMDMFFVCSFVTRIRGQCLKVGEAVYSTVWYQMGLDVQKDICMMIMRSQRPPKITSGKMMELNLHAFMLTMRNIYSWLALFQQLALK